MSQIKNPATTQTVTEDNFEALVIESLTPVLLDFWASWCVPCNLMKRGVEKAAEALSEEVVVGLVNIDQQPGLVAQFGVQGTPTFILVHRGEVVQTFAGMSTSGGLVNRVRQALSNVPLTR